MRIVILGAGALGSILAAHLTRAGEEVTLIARGQRAQWITQHGIAITGLTDFTVPVTVTVQPEAVEEADVLIVAVKTYDTEPALQRIRHLAVGSVLSVQNGVFKNEQLARHFGWEKTLGATAAFAGEVLPDGVVRLTVNEGLSLGELPAGTSARVHALAAVLDRAGIPGKASPQIQTDEWSKYVVFVGLMAVAALTRLETVKLLTDPALASVGVMLQREMAQLAARLGIPLGDYGWMRAKTVTSLPFEEAVADLQHSGESLETRGATAHKVSTLQDLERGRRLEVEEILGYAVRKGTELGMPLPTVDACYRLLTGINRSLR